MTTHPPPSPDRLSDPPSDSRPRDAGTALITVLVTMTVIIALVSVVLTQSLRTLTFVDRTADWNQSLSAAQSGVDDYLARLNADDGYWRTADCTNIALKGNPTVTGTASSCGWGASTPIGWKKVAGSQDAWFHYDANVASTYVDGTITLRSTGKVNKVTRTIEVVLRRGGFGEFLYYTVYETIDPANEAIYGLNNASAAAACTHYYWEPNNPPTSMPRSSSCADINFVTGDRINGPLHTNDALLVNGNPRFSGTVTTSWPACRASGGVAPPASACYRRASGTPIFDNGIAYRAEIELPTNIGDLRQYVTASRTPNPGCLYTGPTRIVFQPTTSGTPMMRVWSKYSTGTLNPGCGSTGTTSGKLGNVSGALVAVPANNLIMVQNVPSTQSTPASGACPTYAVVGSGSTASFNGIGDGLPVANDYNSTLREADCRYGTAYVEGTLKGRVSISTDNDVVVTGDLLYNGGENGTDSLGLIAENSVKIYHPVKQTCTSTRNNVCQSYSYSNLNRNNNRAVLTNITVNAAVLTLKHSFTVQSYNYGAKLSNLRIYGSLAQRFRGPVGTGGSTSGTGYLKDYNYDSRLRYAPPPYFLDPVRSGWGQKTFGEITARYRS